jgi:plastocyanin
MSRRTRLAALVLAALVVTGAAFAKTTETKLRGTVGPGFTIELRDEQGSPVTRLDPGPVELEVEDRSDEHNFHLTGPGGVDVSTTVAEVGSRTFRLTLVDGVYTFLCDPHPTRMRGAFTVGVGAATPPPPSAATPPPPPPPAAKPSAPVGARLTLTSGPGFRITLRTSAGKAVTRLRPGRYTFVVRDRSRAHNARLRGAGASRATGVPFVGVQTWTVTLRKGTLTFQCDPHAATMRGTVRVA